jgi:hypothetical protein
MHLNKHIKIMFRLLKVFSFQLIGSDDFIYLLFVIFLMKLYFFFERLVNLSTFYFKIHHVDAYALPIFKILIL